MDPGITTSLLAGGFGLGGVLSGALLSNYFALRTERRRTSNEDERRWLNDRRRLYAAYLGLAEAMHREVDTSMG
jgi:hypothetical protein